MDVLVDSHVLFEHQDRQQRQHILGHQHSPLELVEDREPAADEHDEEDEEQDQVDEDRLVQNASEVSLDFGLVEVCERVETLLHDEGGHQLFDEVRLLGDRRERRSAFLLQQAEQVFDVDDACGYALLQQPILNARAGSPEQFFLQLGLFADAAEEALPERAEVRVCFRSADHPPVEGLQPSLEYRVVPASGGVVDLVLREARIEDPRW